MSSVGSGGMADISLAVQSATVFSVSWCVLREHHVTASCDLAGVSFQYTQ